MARIVIVWLITGLAMPASAQDLAEHFLRRGDRALTEYIGVRRLEARNGRFKVDGWLEACVALSPTAGFSWHAVAEGGSTYIRNKVLRKALDGEKDTIARGEPARSGLTPDNFQITAADRATWPAGAARLRLVPKRKDLLLLVGSAIVSDPDADLLQVEGRLSKPPSFWTRAVDVVRQYGYQGGVRVPVEMSSTAEVRLAGQSQFHMTYRYLSINGQTLGNLPPGTGPSCLVTQN